MLELFLLRHILFGTVDELELVGSLKRCLNTGVLPQLLRVFIELLQHTSTTVTTDIFKVTIQTPVQWPFFQDNLGKPAPERLK